MLKTGQAIAATDLGLQADSLNVAATSYRQAKG